MKKFITTIMSLTAIGLFIAGTVNILNGGEDEGIKLLKYSILTMFIAWGFMAGSILTKEIEYKKMLRNVLIANIAFTTVACIAFLLIFVMLNNECFVENSFMTFLNMLNLASVTAFFIGGFICSVLITAAEMSKKGLMSKKASRLKLTFASLFCFLGL